jgi:hypothetical protein
MTVDKIMTDHIWPDSLQDVTRLYQWTGFERKILPFNLGELKQLHAGSTLGIAELPAFEPRKSFGICSGSFSGVCDGILYDETGPQNVDSDRYATIRHISLTPPLSQVILENDLKKIADPEMLVA